MRDRFPLLLLGLLLLLGFVGATLMSGARRGDFADKLSTFRADKDGARGLFLLAQESGLPVSRSQADLLTPTDGTTYVLLGTEFAGDDDATKKTHEDEEDVDPFSADAGVESRHGMNVFFVNPVSVDEREKLLDHVKKGNTVIYAPANATNNPFLSAIGVYAFKPDVDVPIRSLVPPVPTPYTLGVERVEAHVDSFFDYPDDATVLLEDDRLDDGAAAVLVPYGNGQVVVLGSAELAMNQSLARANNAQLWLSLLNATLGKNATLFDEFHHGFGGDRSIAEFARRYGLHYAIGQLLLGLCLWALALKRFGRPKTPSEDVRVGSTDALFATSRLYREGRHHAFAAQLIIKELSMELARAAGVAAKSDVTVILSGLRQRGRDRVALAFEQALGASQNVTTEAHVQYVAELAAKTRQLLQTHAQSKPRLVA